MGLSALRAPTVGPWIGITKSLKKVGLRIAVDVARDLKMAADLGFEFVCLCWLVEKIEMIAKIDNLIVRKIKLAPVLEGIKAKKFKPPLNLTIAMKNLEDTCTSAVLKGDIVPRVPLNFEGLRHTRPLHTCTPARWR